MASRGRHIARMWVGLGKAPAPHNAGSGAAAAAWQQRPGPLDPHAPLTQQAAGHGRDTPVRHCLLAGASTLHCGCGAHALAAVAPGALLLLLVGAAGASGKDSLTLTH